MSTPSFVQTGCPTLVLNIKIHGKTLLESLEWGLQQFDNDTEVGLLAIKNNGEALGLSNTKMPWKMMIVS